MDASTLLQPIEIVGALVLLAAPFAPRYRRETPRWIHVITFLAGLSVLAHVSLSYCLDALRAARDPAYWRILSARNHAGGVSIGFLASLVIRYSLSRSPENRDC